MNLENGKHNLTIRTYCDGWDLEPHGFWERPIIYTRSSSLISFTIDTTVPTIQILSPENNVSLITDFAKGVFLTFGIDEPVGWIGYSLDGNANETINGNVTLTALTEGSHNLIIYANDTAGDMGASQCVYFTISSQWAFSKTPWVAAAAAIIIIVLAASTIYLARKRRN